MNDDGHLCALSHSAENSLVSKPLAADLKADLKTSVGGATSEKPGPTWLAMVASSHWAAPERFTD
jgi:hypothetical protein